LEKKEENLATSKKILLQEKNFLQEKNLAASKKNFLQGKKDFSQHREKFSCYQNIFQRPIFCNLETRTFPLMVTHPLQKTRNISLLGRNSAIDCTG